MGTLAIDLLLVAFCVKGKNNFFKQKRHVRRRKILGTEDSSGFCVFICFNIFKPKGLLSIEY